MTNQPAAPTATPRDRPNKVANAIVAGMTAVLIGVGVWWYALRPTPVLDVVETHSASGRFTVEGVVEARLNAATLALRGLSYRGADLDYFQVRDETGVLGVYVDPSDISPPAPGRRVRVTGRRVDASGVDFVRRRPFIASEVVPL